MDFFQSIWSILLVERKYPSHFQILQIIFFNVFFGFLRLKEFNRINLLFFILIRWAWNLETVAVWMKSIHFEYISIIKNQAPSKYLLLRLLIENERIARSFYFAMNGHFIIILDLLILFCLTFQLLLILLISLSVMDQLRKMIL